MKLSFLGTGSGSYRGTGRYPSGAIVDGLLLDCGAGSTGRLHELRRFEEVEAVLLSHLHSDHIGGLLDFLLHTVILGRTRPLTIVSPPGLRPILETLAAARSTVQDPSRAYPLTVVESESPALVVGGWTVRGLPLSHTVPNVGYLASRDGTAIFYTGDTREPTATHSVRADVLIHDATYDDDHRELGRQFGHSTGTQSAEAAIAMGARRLFLTHLSDAPDLERRVAAESRRLFPDTDVASDGATFEL